MAISVIGSMNASARNYPTMLESSIRDEPYIPCRNVSITMTSIGEEDVRSKFWAKRLIIFMTQPVLD